MNARDLPSHARAAISLLRKGFGEGPLPGPEISPALEPRLLSWLTATGLGPAVHKSLGTVPSPGHGKVFLEALEALRHGARARNMALFAELSRIHDASRSAGIDILAMKGVPAIVRLYGGDISLRPMADLDLMVRPGQTAPFLGLLEDLGYRQTPMPIDPFLGERGRHLPPLYFAKRKTLVEVHRGADYRFPGMGASLLPDFFQEAKPFSVEGRPILLPSWTAWTFQWAIHLAYTDAYVGKIRDLYDMAVLLHTCSHEVDWETVIHPRWTLYLLRPLWMGWTLVERLFGPTPPAPWRDRLARIAGYPYPMRDLSEWFIRGNLFKESLFPILPLSVMAALSMPLHLPSWTPRFVGAFLRVVIAP
ncbi:MAG: nucleotidyltransferase family protein, partial [Planctomycetota bacterium]